MQRVLEEEYYSSTILIVNCEKLIFFAVARGLLCRWSWLLIIVDCDAAILACHAHTTTTRVTSIQRQQQETLLFARKESESEINR